MLIHFLCIIVMTSFNYTVAEMSETFTQNTTTGDGRCFFHGVFAGLKKLDIDCGSVETLMKFLGVEPRTFNWMCYDFEPLYKKVVALFGITLAVYCKTENDKYCVFVYTPKEVVCGTVYLHLSGNHYQWMTCKLFEV